jgi:hypothetical protein
MMYPVASILGLFLLGSDAPVTFTKDIAPILQQKCESCHRDGSIAPMSLVSYEETRPWAASIKDEVSARRMPPWHIDKSVGIREFENDRSLSDQQIRTIVRWVDAGAPRGDTADMPAPLEWPDEQVWMFAGQFGEPDLVLKSPVYKVPAQAQDAWYKPVVDTGLTEPRWVRAIEIRPHTVDGRKVTHHALARLEQEEPDADRTNADDDDATSTTTRWGRTSIPRRSSGSISTRRARSRSTARSSASSTRSRADRAGSTSRRTR